MLRGLYSAATGMMAATTATDTLANNLANISTIGFKGNKINFQTFAEMMIRKIDAQGQKPIGSLMNGSKVYETFTNFSAGAIKATGNTFDMAINGDGFFTLKGQDGGTYYTRAGNFMINQEGFLTNAHGDLVQGKLGNIQINLDEGPFSVNQKGEVTGRGRLIDQIQVTQFKNQTTLEKVSENKYIATPASEIIPEPLGDEKVNYKIIPGALEESNVNSVAELVNNIQAQRLYEALHKNIQMHNEALGKAVNEVGRYR